MSKTQDAIMAALRELCPSELRGQLTEDTELIEAGFIDSFAIVRMIQLIEEQFGVRIPDKDIGPAIFASGATISDYVERAQGTVGAPARSATADA
jgi:acyl carrier protein